MKLNYAVVRSKKRKKTISLQVKATGAAVIHAPYRMPLAEIERFVREKKAWLWRKIREHGDRQREIKAKEYAAGETFLFLGDSYSLKIVDVPDGCDKLALLSGQFVLASDKVSEGRELFIDWYKKKAKRYMVERVGHFSRALGLTPRGVKVSNARCRWGSCSQDDRLYFSWRLIMAPSSVIDYVVVHELVHMQEKNHSVSFWNLVDSLIPDYRKQRMWLKGKGHTLDI